MSSDRRRRFTMVDRTHMHRRSFLKRAAALSATATIGAVLAACGGGTATNAPAAATATKPAGGATTAPSGAATSAPAATTAPAAAPAGGTSATTAASSPATTGGAATTAPAAAKSFSGKLTAWGIVSFTK